ncbi:MAG: acyl-ACP--UDP-N-acetylglucosamine O-acyltransferase, partial [Gammaproteobacteria bacterium]
MSENIHPQAIVDPKAKIGKNVTIGPWTMIGPDVEIGDGTWVGPNVVINGPTQIGKNNKIFQFASVGEDPQDMKYKGEKTSLVIGDGNTIREFVSIHRGTVQEEGVTRIGNNNLFVTYSHIAHDCVIGNNIIIGHHVGLAGHVVVDDYAILSAYAAVHQFVRIGAYSFLARLTMLGRDLLPYVMAAGGNDAGPVSINVVGLQRHGYKQEAIMALRRAYKILYRQGLKLDEARQHLVDMTKEFP